MQTVEYDAVEWERDSGLRLWEAVFVQGDKLAAVRLCTFEARRLSEEEGWSIEDLLVREARMDGLDLVRVEPMLPGVDTEAVEPGEREP